MQIQKRFHLKSINLQYITLGCLADGTNDSSTKSLMFQVIFFYTMLFIDLEHSKLFIFIFVKLWKNDFCNEFCEKLRKNSTWKTSDALVMRQLSPQPSNPATQQPSVLYRRLLDVYFFNHIKSECSLLCISCHWTRFCPDTSLFSARVSPYVILL